jgi:carboxypeptidase Taq
VRETRRCYEIAKRIPAELVARMAAARPAAQAAWAEARAHNNFARFAPHLEREWAGQRELAAAIGYGAHAYDALLMKYEHGMTLARLDTLFAELKATLVPLVRAVAAKGDVIRTDFLQRDYDEAAQRAFALDIAQQFGYDLSRGRLDVAAHPFEVSFTRNDVRITTRYKRNFVPQALFGVLHETGHALYELGVAPELTRTAHTTDFLNLYAVGGASFGAHESQSRLWENQIGRSRAFWRHHFGALQRTFPHQLADVDAEAFYRAVNKVTPSYIRVEADELTYNLHIMLRVEIEAGLIDGSVRVHDLPELWREKMHAYLGVTPPTDTLGVLQDIHWSMGSIGSFCIYTIGNVMSGQFMAAAHRQVPDLAAHLAAGRYAPLLSWLTENVYRYGRAYLPDELLQRATGEALNPAPYLAYLNDKYSELYGL